MKTLLTFPTRYLFAANVCAAKKDVRYYLNGVLVTNNEMVATDGHRLLMIPFADDDKVTLETEEDLAIIIPVDAIKVLYSQLAPKERRESETRLRLAEVSGEYCLEANGKMAIFQPIDGRFPSWQAIVPKIDIPEPHSCFAWGYMADFQKVELLLSEGVKCGSVELITNGFNSALVKFPRYPGVVGVLMPVRV